MCSGEAGVLNEQKDEESELSFGVRLFRQDYLRADDWKVATVIPSYTKAELSSSWLVSK